ncbi:hypothetical protein [Microbacterium sp. H1-D42]|uniref:hypothetical protein n=1 Tax=Microbacterium sp. H1-D42 TaxID=2925844 RepID=UPI001F5332A4|nr:hypothetical protein [Microbacterium sp. H1-D42]UNK70082.1 hypothetical protein MNR00_13045 [Microbacterium sp. H1-D42]
MLDDAARARRRELEHKAYAPGGGLSDAEAEELRGLTRPAESEPVAVTPTPAVTAPAPERPEPHERDEAPLERPPAPERAERDEGQGPPQPPTAPAELAKPPRRWLAPLAAVLTLLLGFGAGWLAFGRDGGAPAMTGAQRDVWIELQKSDDLDAGSIELVGSKYGVDAWTATKDDGELDCFFLTGGSETGGSERYPTPSCVQSDREGNEFGLQASASIENDDRWETVWASLIEDITGTQVLVMQRQDDDQEWNWRSQYSGDELPIAEFLDSKGFRGDMLQLIGYDGDVPIWLHQDAQNCVLVATATEISAQACGGLDSARALDLSVPGATYSVRMTDSRGPLLTVIRTPASVVCDVDSGYCATADDKTGFPEE